MLSTRGVAKNKVEFTADFATLVRSDIQYRDTVFDNLATKLLATGYWPIAARLRLAGVQ